MEYKRIDITNYLIIYLILICIILGAIFISKVNNKKQEEQFEVNKQNIKITENLVN